MKLGSRKIIKRWNCRYCWRSNRKRNEMEKAKRS